MGGGSTSSSKIFNPITPTATAEEKFTQEMKKPIIRTYKSDMEETIQTNHLSSINMALAENKRMMRRMEEDGQNKSTEEKNYTKLIVSSVLIILGILAIAIPFFLVNNKYNQPITETPTVSTPIIVADSEEILNIADLDLTRIAKTLSERTEQVSVRLGTIRSIYLSEGQDAENKIITAEKFLSLIGAQVPSKLLRTLKTEYMFGIHNFNGAQRFLILKVGSYDIAYSEMLNWEVELWKDFKTIFNLKDFGQQDEFGDTVKEFQDVVVKNKDTRVVKNDEGDIVFLYAIPEKDTVIITTSTDTLREILSRMNKTIISQ
jgi:hypothetical protein